jgi:hypothetical protein
VAESADKKARRLVTEGRLTILGVNPTEITAECKGDTGEVHQLGYRATTGWICGCEANRTFNRRCSHLIALQLVTVRPAP